MNGQNDTSWWDKLIGGLSQKQAEPPPSPQPPKVDQGAWGKSVEQKKLKDLTVHDVGLIVFNESQSYSDHKDSNEPIGTAREKVAHVIINGDAKWGPDRTKNARSALAVEPSAKALSNPDVRAAYDSSMKAAREAYLSGSDPTNGALFHFQATTPDRSNHVYPRGDPQGVPLRTQSGPYKNSYPNTQVPSPTVWLNNYGLK